jgi:hypothetical protein
MSSSDQKVHFFAYFRRMQAKVLHNSEKCAETEQKRAGRAAQKLARLHKRLATAGIQYDIKLS